LGRNYKGIFWLSRISIFYYIPLIDTIVNETMYLANAIMISLIGLLFFIAGFFVFNKSDIGT